MRERSIAVIGESPGRAARTDFKSLFSAEYAAVFRHLFYLTGNRQIAEDLAQETFGRAFERHSAGELDDLRSPRAWLLRVASNLAFNHFRDEGRRLDREHRSAGAGQSGTAREDAGGGQPALKLVRDAMRPAVDVEDSLDVRTALARLHPRDRAVLLLSCAGFTYAEIAEAVDLKAGSIGTTLARATRRFKEVYGINEQGK